MSLFGTLTWGMRPGLGAATGAGGGVGMVAPGKDTSNGFCGGPTPTPGGGCAVGFSSQGGRPEMMEGSGGL
jgi:hypothetical protein